MDPAKVVVGEPKHDGCAVVIKFFAERIGQAGESPRAHADRKILTLNNRSANSIGVGLTHDWDYLHGGYFRRAVTVFVFARRAVNLDQLGEVAAVMQCGADCAFVGLPAIASKLELASRRCLAHAFDENVRGGLIPFGNGYVQHKFRVSLNGDEDVAITPGGICPGRRCRPLVWR